MSQHRGRLKARLTDDREAVRCGACDCRLAAVRHGFSRLFPADGPRVVAFDVRGWARRDDGVWYVAPEERREFHLARKPVIVGTRDARYPRLPVKVECPACRAVEVLDPSVLDVSPNEKRGYGRTRVVMGLKATDNPAWCAVHGRSAVDHGKHDAGTTC